MSFKNTPITAKIKRTTQGGVVQQPLLNMGGPVKMKMSSPAKQTKSYTQEPVNDFATKINARNKARTAEVEAGKARVAAKSKSDYDTNLSNYKKNVLSLEGDMKVKGGGARQQDQQMRAAGRKSKSITSFENNLYNYDKKNSPDGAVSNYSNAKDYAMSKAMGNTKPGKKPGNGKKEEVKVDTTKTQTTKTKKVSYDTAYKNRDQKTYGKMDKATYIKEAKRQNASKKAGKGWDVKGKGKDTPPRKKVTASTVNPVGIKKVEISTKLDPNTTKTQVTKVNTKTEPKKEVKKTRSQKLRSRGEKALADGNKKKALRIKRRYDKQVAKETKKKGQATGAIQPK